LGGRISAYEFDRDISIPSITPSISGFLRIFNVYGCQILSTDISGLTEIIMIFSPNY
jgi:hypothetical protein